jgi:RHS repeat-associated protein
MLTSAVKTGTNASFVHDPFLRQTQKTVGSTKTKYVYSGSHLMEEYNGATNALLRRYVYAGAEEPIFQIASNGTVTYLHHDHLGSVIAQANASGVVGNKYKYSPWGESPSLTGTTIGYAGYRWDAELSQYHCRARYYRPSTGRFLQTDPVGYQQDLNLYNYCVNNPMNLTDPDGLTTGASSAAEALRIVYRNLRNAQIANPNIEHTAVTGQQNFIFWQNHFASSVIDGTTINSNPALAAATLPVPNTTVGVPVHTHTDAGSWWLASAEDMDTASSYNGEVQYIGLHGEVYSWRTGGKKFTAKTVDGLDYTYGVGMQIGIIDENGNYTAFESPIIITSPGEKPHTH